METTPTYFKGRKSEKQENTMPSPGSHLLLVMFILATNISGTLTAF